MFFYCDIIKYHNVSSLKQTYLFAQISVGMGRPSLLVSLFWVSQGCDQDISRAAFSSGGLTGGESTSKLIQVVGRINFLVIIGFVAVLFFKASKDGENISTSKRKSYVTQHSYGSNMSYSISRSKSQILPTLKGRRLCNGINTRRWGSLEPL